MISQQLHGIGIGLRSCHYPFIKTHKPPIDWFEILADNYFGNNNAHLSHLDPIRSFYPVTLHSVGMSIGSTDSIRFDYLHALKKLIQQVEPLMVSDHLCWTSFNNQYFHELLPLPYTEEAVRHTSERIKIIQDFLGRQIMIENVSSYLAFKHSTMTEWEFLQAVAEEANCLILLDINNIFVSAKNNNFNAIDYLQKLFTKKRVAQFHLGGYENQGTYLLDTHSAAVHSPVWDLFTKAIEKFGMIPTAIEWDNNIPDFPDLLKEAEKAKSIMERYASLA